MSAVQSPGKLPFVMNIDHSFFNGGAGGRGGDVFAGCADASALSSMLLAAVSRECIISLVRPVRVSALKPMRFLK